MIVGIIKLIVLVVDTVCFIPVVVLGSLADSDGKLGFHVARYCALLNNRVAGVRLHIEGLEHLDPRVPYVSLSNHRSHMDVLTLIEAAWRFELRWVTTKELTRVPRFGWALRATRLHVVQEV